MKQITCGVFLIDKFNRMLVTHPTNHDPHHWTIPKGLANEGEGHLTAMTRELKEETGIDLNDLKYTVDYLGIIKYSNKDKWLSAFIVKCENHLPARFLRCDSMFHHKKTNTMMPECDKFQWVDIDIAEQIIQAEQQKIWSINKEVL